MFCSPAAGVRLGMDSVPCWPPVPSLCGAAACPRHSGTALTEEGSSIEPDGGLAAHRFLLKDGIKELVRESEGLAEMRKTQHPELTRATKTCPLGQQHSMPLRDWSR